MIFVEIKKKNLKCLKSLFPVFIAKTPPTRRGRKEAVEKRQIARQKRKPDERK